MLPDPVLAWSIPRNGSLVERRSPRIEVRSDRLNHLRLTDRDRRILSLAHEKLGGAKVDLDEALRALGEAVREMIPAGRTYLLGTTEHGPIVGSILSGVGIAASPEGVVLLRVGRDGRRALLGSFFP